MKRIISVMLCAVLIAVSLCGCSDNSEILDFIYPFGGDINSFDPQVAGTQDEFLIIENCYEGLVRVLDDGTVQAGVAESWNVSGDGLTYTFKLRKGAKWNVYSEDKDRPTKAQELMGFDFNPDITAGDFVFALQRAVDKNTQSPLYSTVANIKNAAKIHSGKMAVGRLGVRAIDDYTLEIRLESADDGFMSVLSTAVAMPCNKEYFYATKGRYGLGLNYTIFNGQFYVSSILEASYILKNNKKYVGEYPSKVTDITLNITDDNSEITKRLKSGYYDCAYISGKEYASLGTNDITALPYANKMWALMLNKNKLILSNKKLRQAICLAASRPDVEQYTYLENATTFTPPSCLIGNESAVKQLGKTVAAQNPEKAQELWKKGLEETNYSIADITVIITEEMEDIAKQLVQGIQSSIGSITGYGKNGKISFSLKIEVLNQEDFNTEIAKGDYDIALYRFTASSHSCTSYLESIINEHYSGDNNSADKALLKAQSANAASTAAACSACERAIMNDYSILPLFYEASYYAEAKGVSGVNFHAGSGRVCFVNAIREK